MTYPDPEHDWLPLHHPIEVTEDTIESPREDDALFVLCSCGDPTCIRYMDDSEE